MQRVKNYTTTWEARCYKDGIPDEVPKKLQQTARVPSYKAIAMAILKNDFQLHSIGFTRKETFLSTELMNSMKARKQSHSSQLNLFDSEPRD